MANPNWKLTLIRAILIVAAGFWVFAPALRGDWLMDDDFYVTHNVLLGDPARLWKIWFAPGSLIEYYPVEASLQAVQWHFWHNETLGYHLTNLVLHVIGALLVWRLLGKFGLRLAWLGGLLFVIHPVVVESVAWIAEFKNVLSLPPFLLAMGFWIDYEERGRMRDYVFALGLFLIAMLCKITMAPFPVVILLYAWWKRGRVGWGDLKASAPFFIISLTLGAMTILAGKWYFNAHLQPIVPVIIGGLLSRVALAGTTLTFYFFKCLWPVDLLPIYPMWPVNPPALIEFFPWLILGGLLAWFWSRRKNWGRHAFLGLGFFLLNLAPFLGFLSINYMTFTWVMDHFLYIPIIGLIGLTIAGWEQGDGGLSNSQRPLAAGLAAVVFALLAWESHAYAGLFINQEKLWTYTVKRNPAAFVARNNLGNVYMETGRVPEAIEQYEEAIRINPNMPEANNNLGLALSLTGRQNEAIAAYERALKINPHFALAHANLGDTLQQAGRNQEAIGHYEESLRINPTNSGARDNLKKLQSRQNPPQK